MPCVACISEGAALPWRYRDGESALTVEPRGRVRSNDAEYVRACVLMGLGMGHGPEWLFADDIRSGTLVEVLDGHAAPPQALSIVTPAGRRNPGKAQAFIDYLAERFQGKPPVDTDSLTATAGVVQVRRLA